MGFGEIIVALGAIAGAIYGIFKFSVWKWGKTPSEVDHSIEDDVNKREKETSETGRPH